MAKKTRRARRSSPPARNLPRASTAAGAEQLEQEVIPTVHPPREPARSRAATTTRPAVHADFRAEYPYVAQDLKRIAILATTMFGVLIVLAFVLR